MADPFRTALDSLYAHSGVDVTIPFAPGATGPLTARAIREQITPDTVPLGTEVSELRAGEDRAVYSFRRYGTGGVRDLPVGTLFEAPELAGGTVFTWKVESLAHKTPDAISVLVRQVR